MARFSARRTGHPGMFRRWGASGCGRFVPAALCALSVVAVPFIASTDVSGAEFRSRIQIRTPEAAPPGAVSVSSFRPVNRAMVEEGLRKIFAAYGANPAKLGPMLASRFQDKSRLLDSMNINLPRDVKLNLLALEAVNTLRQHVVPGAPGAPGTLVSMVNATARTQLVYNDPKLGYQRLEGSADYLLRVRQPMARRQVR